MQNITGNYEGDANDLTLKLFCTKLLLYLNMYLKIIILMLTNECKIKQELKQNSKIQFY